MYVYVRVCVWYGYYYYCLYIYDMCNQFVSSQPWHFTQNLLLVKKIRIIHYIYGLALYRWTSSVPRPSCFGAASHFLSTFILHSLHSVCVCLVETTIGEKKIERNHSSTDETIELSLSTLIHYTTFNGDPISQTQ